MTANCRRRLACRAICKVPPNFSTLDSLLLLLIESQLCVSSLSQSQIGPINNAAFIYQNKVYALGAFSRDNGL